jgi:hypothetical protein
MLIELAWNWWYRRPSEQHLLQMLRKGFDLNREFSGASPLAHAAVRLRSDLDCRALCCMVQHGARFSAAEVTSPQDPPAVRVRAPAYTRTCMFTPRSWPKSPSVPEAGQFERRSPRCCSCSCSVAPGRRHVITYGSRHTRRWSQGRFCWGWRRPAARRSTNRRCCARSLSTRSLSSTFFGTTCV